jgi:hypothetical protein
MKVFKEIIIALGVASIGFAAAPAVAQDRHYDGNAYHHNDRGMHRGHGWNHHHRHCRTEWHHHHRVTRCR